MGCQCNASSGNGPCNNRGCRSCYPYTSCDPAVPTTCEPLGITGAPSMIVVEDSAYCKHTMQTPDTAAIMTVNPDTGRPEWNTGDALCLPDLPTNTATRETRLLVQDEDCFKGWGPDYSASTKQVIIADQATSDFGWAPATDIYPSTGCGVLVKDCGGDTEDEVSFQSGTEGQALVIDSDGNPRFDDLAGLGLGVGIQGLAANNTTSSIVTITAKKIVLFDGSNNSFRVTSVNVTADITINGAGGLDTGSEASSTWYYFYVIYNPTTVDTKALLSISATSPTLPNGYTYYRPLGAVRNDGSNNFINFYQFGNSVAVDNQNVFTGTTGVTSYTSQSLSSYVPPIAVQAIGMLGNTDNGTDIVFSVASTSTGIGANMVGSTTNATALDSFYAVGTFNVILASSQTIYWKTSNTDTHYRMNISGYTLNL